MPSLTSRAPNFVTAYVDPGCPWTWMTSRWLVDCAERLGVPVRWRTFSLGLLNEGQPIPAAFDTPEFHAHQVVVETAIRLLQATIDSTGDDVAGRLYTTLGEALHVRGEADLDLVRRAAKSVGVEPLLDTVAKPEVVDALRRSLDEALALAGPGVGSPVLHFAGESRGAFGPIVSPPPKGEAGVALWEAVVALHRAEAFFELKRGRSGPPVLDSGER